MKALRLALFLAAFPSLLSATRAPAQTFEALLRGTFETPPNPSTGGGIATVHFDPSTKEMQLHLDFSGLTGSTTALFLEMPTPLPGSAITGPITPDLAGFPLGVTSGIYDITLDMSQASSYAPAFLAANAGNVGTAEALFQAGLSYGNDFVTVSSSVYPAGEITDALRLIPEPGTMTLLGLGGLSLVFFARHRA